MSETKDPVSDDQKITFKKKSRFGQRRKRLSSEEPEVESEESQEWNKLEELKQIQSQRKRCNKGINILELAQNSTTTPKSVANGSKTDNKGGGLTDAKTLSYDLDLGHTFSVETNRRDEDTDLMKYIEEELSKRKGKQVAEKKPSESKSSNQLNSLFDILPDHLIANNSKKSEEMLSNQMLNGIPEVELGLEEKIRNIEATEEAKARLLEAKNKRSQEKSASFVPNNIAVCFVQNNRSNADDVQRLNTTAKRVRTETQQQSNTYVEEPVVVIGDEPKQVMKLQNTGGPHHQKGFYGKDKATDDYLFEKFKKQFKKF